jgi:hypothetical protein
MARIAYDSGDAAAFAETRHLADEGLASWRAAIARYLTPRPGIRLLDLGSGTGAWAQAFANWYDGIDVVAVDALRGDVFGSGRCLCRWPRPVLRTSFASDKPRLAG